ncbi:MAG: PqqD family protein [Myxococcales bacterium]|nr:PqqD family protein [Myxococcales bacterium]
MKLDAQTRVRQSSRIAARVIGGKAVVVVNDRRRSHVLDEVGTRIWELADGRSLSGIAAQLVEDYEVDAPRALSDVIAFAHRLLEEGAMEVLE